MTESNRSLSYNLAAAAGVQNKSSMNKEATEASKSQIEIQNTPEQEQQSTESEVKQLGLHTNNENGTGEFNMEAAITADDVLRAGGFGARDDIGSFLPVAIDSTDFEASLRDARDFEEPQGETSRPGLGWTESVDDD